DVLRGLVPQAKHDAAEKILHLGRVLQSPAKGVLHPSPRLLRRAQNRISTAMSNERPVLRVANKEHSTDAAAREVRAYIELAGVSRRRYRLGSPKKLQFVAR